MAPSIITRGKRRLGEAEDLLFAGGTGGFPYIVQRLKPQMGKVSIRNHFSGSGKIRQLKYHMKAQRSSAG